MELNSINHRVKSKKIRVGRGIGSGKGKTSGRGHKGQKSRSGVAIKGFEGGQMPIHMRLPKRGFNNFTRKDFAELTLGNLQNAITKGLIDKNNPITEVELNAAGIVKKSKAGIKLLNKGDLKDKIEISLSKATKSCVKVIEELGGKVSILELPKVKRIRKKDGTHEEEKEIKAESAPSSQDSEEIKNKEVAESSTQETADK